MRYRLRGPSFEMTNAQFSSRILAFVIRHSSLPPAPKVQQIGTSPCEREGSLCKSTWEHQFFP